jgi:hypothetical protein
VANFKVTWFFETVDRALIGASAALGWTETWYLGGQPGSLDTMFDHPDVINYTKLRRDLLTPRARISFIRISDDNNPRLVKIQSLSAAIGSFDKLADVSDHPAQIQCAVLVDLQRLPIAVGEPVHHRRFLIRGLHVGMINGNVLDPGAPGFAALTRFLNFIGKKPTGGSDPAAKDTRSALGIRYHDPSVAWILIRSLGSGKLGGGGLTVGVQPIIPGLISFPHPSQVEIRDVPQPLARYNRTWNYLGLDNAGISMILGKLRKPTGQDLYVANDGAARMRVVKYLYGPVDQYAIIGLRTKKTGRLFRQLRGRSSPRG